MNPTRRFTLLASLLAVATLGGCHIVHATETPPPPPVESPPVPLATNETPPPPVTPPAPAEDTKTPTPPAAKPRERKSKAHKETGDSDGDEPSPLKDSEVVTALCEMLMADKSHGVIPENAAFHLRQAIPHLKLLEHLRAQPPAS